MQWVDTIASKTAGLHRVGGVHVQLCREGTWQVGYVVLRRKGQELILEKKDMLSWEEFLQQHPKTIPIVLSIDGKGVLTKSVAGGEAIVLENILPNATEADFYYNTLESATNSWISLTRRTVLQELLQAAKAVGISIADIRLGPLGIVSLLPLLQEAPAIQLPHWQVAHRDGVFVGLLQQEAASTQVYRLGEESLAENYLQPYANALSNLAKLDIFDDSNLEEVRLGWQHQRLYKRLGIGLLAFFFSLLLLNFGVFSQLSGTQQRLNTKLQQQQHLLARLQELTKQEEARLSLLKALPLRNQSLIAYHADLLASTLPAGIQLEEVVLHPQEGKKSKQQSLRFRHGFVEVKGQCNNPVLLNRWLEKLGKEPWVKALKDQRYSSTAAGQLGSSFGFTLELAGP